MHKSNRSQKDSPHDGRIATTNVPHLDSGWASSRWEDPMTGTEVVRLSPARRRYGISTRRRFMRPNRILAAFRDLCYGGRAFADALAREGFAVLVHDVFLRGSRRFALSSMTEFDRHTWMLFPNDWSSHGDWSDLVACRAPSPLLVQYDRDDPLYTTAGMRAADRRLRAHYRRVGATGNYRGEFYPGPHKFDVPMQKTAFAWLEHQLGRVQNTPAVRRKA